MLLQDIPEHLVNAHLIPSLEVRGGRLEPSDGAGDPGSAFN